METTRNRAAVLAKFLRASTKQLRDVGRRVDAEAEISRGEALASINGVAEVLEDVAAGPAPLPDPEAQR
jgi:hypothetical protein